MMTSEQVRKVIDAELVHEEDLTNVFGVDLTKRMISPIKQDYRLDNGEIIELWTVLRENEVEDGYVIFYDEEDNMFGLGKESKEGMHNIGYHGTFLETLYSM